MKIRNEVLCHVSQGLSFLIYFQILIIFTLGKKKNLIYLLKIYLVKINLGQYSLSGSDSLVKTAISRSVVFMMENEWPQNWPELFPQFQQVINDPNPKLFPQCQMVFIVLKRLIEDVVTLANIEDCAKRKDLSVAISAHMREIFTMCIVKIRFCIETGMNGFNSFFLFVF